MQTATSLPSRSLSPMRAFDPVKVARYEKDSWVAYYRRRWLTLLRLLIGLVRSTYGMSLWQAITVGIPLTRAQMAFAPQDNDVPQAIEYMRRFFAYVKRLHQEDLDPDEAARAEVNWWVVHRKFFGQSDNPAVIEAVAQAYAAAYHVDPAQVREAAYHRARAMVYSDAWVKSKRDPRDLLLNRAEEELVESYTALRAAVSTPQG
jgi:hypothetical protein